MYKDYIRDKALGFKDTILGRKILKPELSGGLSNKLYCLMSACEIAYKNNYKILEPEFGWKSKILFSDIYNLEYFNQTMEELTGMENILISSTQKLKPKKFTRRSIFLWEHSEHSLRGLREKNIIYQNSMMVYLIKSLKLKNEFEDKVFQNLPNSLAAQFRVESDWIEYAKKKVVNQHETLLIDPKKLIDMIIEFNSTERIFFTTGENQPYIQKLLLEKGIESSFFFDPNLEYEINAAINFEILAKSKKFIGLSRSTLSNLITFKRQLLLNDNENYIYNYGEKITLRNDFGLYPSALDSINKMPLLV